MPGAPRYADFACGVFDFSDLVLMAGGWGMLLNWAGGAPFGVWFFKVCDLSACFPLTSLVLFPLGGLNPFCAGIDDSASGPIPLLESDS